MKNRARLTGDNAAAQIFLHDYYYPVARLQEEDVRMVLYYYSSALKLTSILLEYIPSDALYQPLSVCVVVSVVN